jgi:hypothetical protein
MVAALFDRAWNGVGAKERLRHKSPPPVDPLHYGYGKFLDPSRASIVRGWRLGVPEWSQLAGSKRGRFRTVKMLCASEPGAELALDFRGTLVGAYVVAGPDAGILEGTVDGEAFAPVNLYHRFSKGLHYPRTVLFQSNLKPGEHRLLLRIADTTASKGKAARILQFVVNDASESGPSQGGDR